jgi:hypothetical protein
LCERPGCLGPAEVSYGIDNAQLTVWMDVFHVPDRGHTGHLCRRHADALAVPRGWTIDDRRQPIPQLFRDRHLDAGSKALPVAAGSRDAGGAPRGGGRGRSTRRGARDAGAELFAVVEDEHVDSAHVDPDETRAIAWSPSHVTVAHGHGSVDGPDADDDPPSIDGGAEPPVMGRLLGRAFRKNA